MAGTSARRKSGGSTSMRILSRSRTARQRGMSSSPPFSTAPCIRVVAQNAANSAHSAGSSSRLQAVKSTCRRASCLRIRLEAVEVASMAPILPAPRAAFRSPANRGLFARFFQQLVQPLERPMPGIGFGPRWRRFFELRILHARVLVLVAVHAQELPVAAVGRVVVVVAVLVVHGELAQTLAAELARAAAADPRQDLERLLAVGAGALLLRFFRLGDEVVELGHDPTIEQAVHAHPCDAVGVRGAKGGTSSAPRLSLTSGPR